MHTTRVSVALSSLLCFACAGDKEATDDSTSAEEVADETADEAGTEAGTEGNEAPSDETADSNPFIPDDEDIPGTANSCDPFMQDCPDGEKCVPYASSGGTWDANKCVTVTGDGATGDSCVYGGASSGTDDCDEENVCWNALDVDGQLIGTCFPFCTGGADNPVCADADQSCRIVNDGTIAVCLPNCDPLLQECEDGLGCYWSGGSQTFQCIITAGGIPTGEPCGFNNDCNPGHFCAAAEALEMCNGSACCATFCDTADSPGPCAAPLECVAFFEEGTAPPMYETLGLCILPI